MASNCHKVKVVLLGLKLKVAIQCNRFLLWRQRKATLAELREADLSNLIEPRHIGLKTVRRVNEAPARSYYCRPIWCWRLRSRMLCGQIVHERISRDCRIRVQQARRLRRGPAMLSPTDEYCLATSRVNYLRKQLVRSVNNVIMPSVELTCTCTL